jgi:hypothetical protein
MDGRTKSPDAFLTAISNRSEKCPARLPTKQSGRTQSVCRTTPYGKFRPATKLKTTTNDKQWYARNNKSAH